ncbi:MAG TPA: ScpA family protein [Ferrovibrio sp.]|uniref:segregation and condensation protein A n=1 Tax=Ferrovibrio sp. TaxID=1917215 RepID=UPI002B4AF444|nr:ScpA family protein [Ferrovibrio sp.]HLT77236.1 ScpA family protein [Ferrovibrio sp.]
MTEPANAPDPVAAPETGAAAEPFEAERRDGLPQGVQIGEQLVLNLDVFEGPLDVLLTLAREQKVDLRRISILALAEQYLAFIQELRRVRIEVAADYLVMAAWLAYLKSRLLIPEPEKEGEPSGADMAARLALQLQRLEAMRKAADQLMQRDQVGLAMFLRGKPEGVRIIRKSIYNATLYELLKAYAEFRASKGSGEVLTMKVARRRIVSVEEALARLRNMIGQIPDWATLQAFLPAELDDPFTVRSALASTFNASLEMAKQGLIELKQVQTFGPIYIRRQQAAPAQPEPAANSEE